MMDPKVLYWTGAFANMVLITVLAFRGVGQVRRGDVAGHRRQMLWCAWLVVAFLVSYGLKVWLLGREALFRCDAFFVDMLRFHETCVLVMIVGVVVALSFGRAMRGTRNRTREAADPPAPERTLRVHRLSGRTAIVGLVFAVLSAFVVLSGMYLRS